MEPHTFTRLLVDDEPNVVQGLRRALRKEPYKVLTANSGDEGLKILDATPVDVVVSDEQMPGMPGSQFLAAVCKRYPKTVRIMLTGEASLEAAIRAINEGEIYRFLTKPTRAEDFTETIRLALQLKELSRHSMRLLSTARQQRAILSDLEDVHPGITAVERSDDGTIVIDSADSDLEGLMREIGQEVALFESHRKRGKKQA